MLETFADRNWFTESFGDVCIDWIPIGWKEERICHKFSIRNAPIEWPIEPSHLANLDLAQIRWLLNFFFEFVSEPEEQWFHQFCEGTHPSSDVYFKESAKVEYARQVNAILVRLALPISFDSGELFHVGGVILSPRLGDRFDYAGDNHLERLVEGAIAKFQTHHLPNQASAVTDLANALERLKSDPILDKRLAVESLVAMISPAEKNRPAVNSILLGLRDLSNGITIRHHEYGKTEIGDDPHVLEYLFFEFYNMIRLILSKQENSKLETAIPFSEN